MTDWRKISKHISDVSRTKFEPEPPSRLAGGCISTAVKLRDQKQCWFVKLNQRSMLAMFEAEAEGLAEIIDSAAIRAPRPLCTGTVNEQSYIVMEYLQLSGRPSSAQAGRNLAAMHKKSSASFGWHRDNTIGATPQKNAWSSDWVSFWQTQRLGYQLELAALNGHTGRLQSSGEKLLACLDQLIGHSPSPSLLHGDLWGGNIAYDEQNNPVIYDPAVYYGDREADLAMTELFGGFGNDFISAYNEAWPIDTGYQERKALYNLYHILNHLNLFGSGYHSQAQNMIDRLLTLLG